MTRTQAALPNSNLQVMEHLHTYRFLTTPQLYLYALEMYNGIDTKRVHAQLEKHLVALGEGRISELYRYPKAHRVLCVFETESALQAAIRRLCEDAAFTDQMRHQFAFSTLGLACRLCRLLAFSYPRPPDDLRQLTAGIAG